MSFDINNNNGYAKVQYRYVLGEGGKVVWQKVEPTKNEDANVKHTYQNVNVNPMYQNLNVIGIRSLLSIKEEPIYAELSFTPFPKEGKNGPSTNAEKHAYAELINVKMMRRPLPPVPGKGGNNLSNLTNAEEHYDWPKVSYVWMDPIYKNANYVREHIYATIADIAPEIPPSEKKVQGVKSILRSIKNFFVNLFKSKKTVNSSEIPPHEQSYIRFDNCDAVISDNIPAATLGDGPNSKVKELKIAQDTIVMSTYC